MGSAWRKISVKAHRQHAERTSSSTHHWYSIDRRRGALSAYSHSWKSSSCLRWLQVHLQSFVYPSTLARVGGRTENWSCQYALGTGRTCCWRGTVYLPLRTDAACGDRGTACSCNRWWWLWRISIPLCRRAAHHHSQYAQVSQSASPWPFPPPWLQLWRSSPPKYTLLAWRSWC